MVIEKDLVEDVAVTAVAEEPTEPACKHHWVIETANGPISRGSARFAMKARSSTTPSPTPTAITRS